MAPLPKRRHSKARRDSRRANDGLQALNLVACPQCGTMRRPHQVCPECGSYKGKTVVEMKSKKKD